MTVEPALLVFAVVLLGGYAVQTATGFGSTLICVTLGSHLIGIDEVLTLTVPFSFLQTSYIAIRHYPHVDAKLLLRRVLPLMGVGMGISFVFFSDAESPGLKSAFGLLVLVLSARDLYLLHTQKDPSVVRPMPRPVSIAAMLGAGVVHGIYASGGPLLVYSLGRESLSKQTFRATVSSVWLVLDTVLLVRFALEGRYQASTGLDLLVLLPAVPLGVLIGEQIHRRVDERRFKTLVFLLLICAGISLLF